MQEKEIQPVPTSRPAGLVDYVQVVVRRGKIVVRGTLAATVVAVIWSLFSPDIYTAKTMILPAQEDKGLMLPLSGPLSGMTNMASSVLGGPTTVDLYVTMLRSEAVKDPIIERFKLMDVYRDKYRTDAYKVLDKRAGIFPGKKDGIITITIDDEDPGRAAAMANAYVEELGNLAVRLNIAGAGQNRSFLEERVGKAKAELAKAEENLKLFQAGNKAVQMTAQAEATIKSVAEMRAAVAAREVELATRRRQFTESSQEVKNLATSIRNLKLQLARMEGGSETRNSALPSVGSIPAMGRESVRLMREVKVQESVVESLTKQLEMARLSEAKNISPFQVILKAQVPERKSKPARVKIVLSVTLAALFLSLFAAFVGDYFCRMTETDKKRWSFLIENQ